MAFKFGKGMQAGTRGIPASSLRTGAKVDRSPRVGPTPETLDKLQPDGLLELLALGPEHGGIDPMAHEALLEIEAAFHMIARHLGGGSGWVGELSGAGGDRQISDKDARWWAIWNLWATEFWRRHQVTGVQIAATVEARRSVDPDSVALLRRAAGLWDQTCRDFDAQQSA